MSSNTDSVLDWDCIDVGKYLEKVGINSCLDIIMIG